MYVLRIALVCGLVGWMAADAHAQLGTYGAPDPISWSQDNMPVGSQPMLASRTAYVTPADGSVPTPPMPAHDSSALGSMLAQPGPAVPPVPNGDPTIASQGASGNCESGNDCGWNNCCCGCCSPWFASFDFLYMGRSEENKLFTSYEWGAPVNQGHFDNFDWTPGGQVTLGYRFGCCCDWAIQGVYWGLGDAQSDSAPVIAWSTGVPGTYGTPMNMGLVSILGTVGGGPNGTSSALDYYTNSPNQHIWRDWEVQDVEINLVKNIYGGCDSRASVDFLVGVRWFRFQDGLVFGSQRANDGTAYAGDWLLLDDHITNDLVGIQAGFDLSYRICDCWKAFIRPEFGIFDDHMELNYNMYAVSATTGQQYQASSSTYANPNYPVHSTNDGFSFLTQVDVGLNWQVTRHFGIEGGYRVVAISGVGLANNQVPFYGNDTQAIADIDRNGSLIVDGAFVGITFNW